MNYKFTTILILLFFSPNVFAFPVAESISLYSIFSYWFFSLFAGGSYLLGDKHKYRFYQILSIIIVVAFALTIGLISHNQKIEMNTSVNSLSFNFKYLKAKPYAITAKEEEEIKKYLLDLERNKINIFEDLGVFFKKNKETKFIYLHEEQELKTANPTINTIFKYEDGKENELLNFVDNYTGEYRIYASNPVKAANVSLKIFKRTGKITTVVLQSPQMMSDVRSYAAIKNPFLQEQIDKKTVKKTSWNEADLVDVSTYFEVMEKHAVVQAELFPVENVWQMTDNEVIAWLVRNNGKKFISSNHSNLVILENRLQRLNVDLNQFNISYIQQFYENNGSGYPITPYFFNNGSTYTTEVLRDELIKTDDIKILCFSYDKCKLKIPTERFDVINVNPFVDNFAEEFKKIDKTKKYVAVIDNRYEYGWAVKYGYWMNTNKDYANFLGVYYLPQRLDYYEWLKTNLDHEHQFKGTSLYEKLYGVMNEILNIDKEEPDHVLLKFFMLGGLVKLTLIAIFGWMYFSRNTKLKTAYSLLNVVTLISIVYSLTWILERYSLVPFFWYSNMSYNYELVFLCFMGLLSLSCFIKTQSIKITAIVSLILLIMYITGLIYSINVVVAMFIIGLEVFNVLFELYFLHKTRSKHKGVGIYKTTDALNSNLLKTKKFPEKWLLVNKYRKTDGYLVDLSGKTEKQAAILNELFNKPIIIRSCATSSVEQNLAGYYESVIFEKYNFKVINDALIKFKSQMDFVWIQEYINAPVYGVVKSFDNSLSKIFIAYGKAQEATEGAKSVKEGLIDRNQKNSNKMFDDIKKEIMKMESVFNSPIVAEFIYYKNKVIISQIRLDNEDSKIKALKFNLDEYILCESYITTSSRLTGSILEIVTANDFIWINGFIYEKIKRGKSYCHINKTLLSTHNQMDLIEKSYVNNEITQLGAYVKINELLKIYSQLYQCSKSSIGANKINTSMGKYSIGGKEVEVVEAKPDLDFVVANKFNIGDINLREQVRLMNIRVVFLLNLFLTKYTNKNIYELRDISIKDLQSTQVSNVSFFYDKKSFKEKTTKQEYLVDGEMSGEYWLANEELKLPPSDGKTYILVGEEIGSSWVMYLDRFSGLMSVYGNEATHLAISAKEMKKPYKKIDISTFQKIKSKVQ